jgi:hypothetical protein
MTVRAAPVTLEEVLRGPGARLLVAGRWCAPRSYEASWTRPYPDYYGEPFRRNDLVLQFRAELRAEPYGERVIVTESDIGFWWTKTKRGYVPHEGDVVEEFWTILVKNSHGVLISIDGQTHPSEAAALEAAKRFLRTNHCAELFVTQAKARVKAIDVVVDRLVPR